MPKKLALLIGINYYVPGDQRRAKFENLDGCVQDVIALEEYFRDVLNVTHITKLTSSSDQTEDVEALPTHDNIVRELHRITNELSQPGDLVYIHYSGHGIRRDGRPFHDGGDNISGTALVPMNVLTGGAYLTGYQLGIYVKNMVKKGLRVAITLDSCFSGRGLRGGLNTDQISKTQVDYLSLPSDETADEMAHSADLDGNEDMISSLGYRNATARYSWLSNPTNCTVLTACRVNDFAKEDSFGSRKSGVFTHYMLELLRKYPTTRLPSYQRVSDYLYWRLSRERFAQRPVLHGDSLQEFFGEKMIAQRPSCHISETINGLEIDIGKTQGVAVGAVYDVLPESWDFNKKPTTNANESSFPSPDDPLSRVRVVRAMEYRSIVESMSFGGSIPIDMRPKTGCRATLRSWALPLSTYVTLAATSNVDNTESIKATLQAEFEKMPGLFLCPHGRDDGANFTIRIDSERNITIQDEQGMKLNSVPRLSMTHQDALPKLAYILSHISRFQAIEQLQYGGARNLLPGTNFAFELQDENGLPLPMSSPGKYEVFEDTTVVASFVNNKTTRPAHVALFVLSPTWGIHKIYPPGGQPVEETHEGEPILLPMTMEVPPELELDSIEDIIRAYIYDGEDPPSWNELALPDLPMEARLIPHNQSFEAEKVMPCATGNRNVRIPRVTPLRANYSNVWTVLDLKVRTSRTRS